MKFLIIVFIFGTALCHTLGEVRQCPDTVCDMAPPLQMMVKGYVDDAFAKYSEDRLCNIVRYIRQELTENTGLSGWNVFLGSDGLFTSRQEYSLQYDRVPGHYFRYTYKYKHDVEVFRTNINDKSPFIATNKSGIARSVPKENVVSDMPKASSELVRFISDQGFQDNNGNYEKTAVQIRNEVTKYCPAHWVVVVASHGSLDAKNFCGAYNRHVGTYFSGKYKRSEGAPLSHEVLLFAPS